MEEGPGEGNRRYGAPWPIIMCVAPVRELAAATRLLGLFFVCPQEPCNHACSRYEEQRKPAAPLRPYFTCTPMMTQSAPGSSQLGARARRQRQERKGP